MLRCLQDLRTRQRLGLPPPAPVTEAAAAAVAAAASPFAALSQAAFPGGGGPDASGVAAAVAAAQPGAQANAPASNLLMCDSTLLRLLSTSLQGTWQRHEASDAAAALLRDTEVQAAVRAVEAAAGLHPGSQQHLLQQQLHQQQVQFQQLQQQDEVAASLLTCDSGMLRMLSDSLRGFWQPQDASDAAAAALLRDTGAHTTVAAAMAAVAAQASAAAKPAPTAPAAAAAATAFAAAAMQPLAAAPLLHTLQQAGAPLPMAAGARPLSMALPAAGPNGNRQTSLDVFNNSLLALGLTGAAGGAQAPLPAEFLRLCSLPIAADMLPLNFD
jgi:DNA polymerase-3 subunit gamma/tau